MASTKSDHIHAAIAARNNRSFMSKAIDWVRTKPEGGIAVLFCAIQIIVILVSFAYPSFRYVDPANIAVTLKAIAPLGIMALGVSVLMIAGEFDLSVGALYSFCSIVVATLTMNWGGDVDAEGGAMALAPFAALIVGLAIGAGAGILHALVTLRFNIPSFITTLGAMLMWKGATLLYHGAQSLRFKPGEPFNTLFNSSVGVVHASMIWFIILSVAFYFLLHHHKLGNHFYAVGGNRNAAVAIGVNPARTKIIAFGICGFMAALAGTMAGARVMSIQPGGGLGLELQAIAACVIGGAALNGGRGSILGVFLGTALMYTIQDLLLLLRAPGFYFDMFVGGLIVISVITNMAIRRRG